MSQLEDNEVDSCFWCLNCNRRLEDCDCLTYNHQDYLYEVDE